MISAEGREQSEILELAPRAERIRSTIAFGSNAVTLT
jgi:hypothetical protein